MTMESKSGIAVVAQHPVSGGISEFSEFSAESKTTGFFPILYSVSVYMIHRKELKWMWPTGFPLVVTRADQAAIGHHGFNANFPMSLQAQLAPILHKIRVAKFSLPICFHVCSFFFIGKKHFTFIPVDVGTSPGTKFICLAPIFITVKRFFASWAYKFCLWHGCYHIVAWSHCQ
jgi:hypothetical protein